MVAEIEFLESVRNDVLWRKYVTWKCECNGVGFTFIGCRYISYCGNVGLSS